MSLVNTSLKDWDKFLEEKGLTHKDVDHYMKNIIDTPEFNKKAGRVIKLPTNKYIVKDSDIHGDGVFATECFSSGDILGVVMGMKDGFKYRSCLGRFTNHSNIHNVVLKEVEKTPSP